MLATRNGENQERFGNDDPGTTWHSMTSKESLYPKRREYMETALENMSRMIDQISEQRQVSSLRKSTEKIGCERSVKLQK